MDGPRSFSFRRSHGAPAIVFAGEGAGPLVEAILAQPCLDGGLASKGEAVLGAFANGEVRVQLKSNVRGLRVVIVATCSSTAAEGRTLNDLEAQAQLMVQAARESDASEILLVYPTLPYARSEKKTAAREPIAAARTVKVAFALGATRILAIDLHAAAVQGFASPHPLDNLYAAQLLQEAIAEEMLARLDGHASTSATTRPPRWILVSPDVGGEKRIESYAAKLQLRFAVGAKHRDYSRVSTVTSVTVRTEEGTDLRGAIALIVDDMVDTAGTIAKLVEALLARGVSEAWVVATHAPLSGQAIPLLAANETVTRLIVTDATPVSAAAKAALGAKLRVVSIAPLLAAALAQMATPGGSLSALFSAADGPCLQRLRSMAPLP